ncbi:EamA family transporter [Flavobacterium dauae]|uniref:EamA family transporter n=1 Tax=Flavobacterium dauae TaxID=1563479 RepID=UPI00101D2384|nr:EamA family transporter [Flavobacterium dauae]WLD25158.1 EamA family transporter [Flavobacterium dauae]
MLASFVKMAYKQGFTTAEVTISQYVFAIICLLVINFFIKNTQTATKKNIFKLILSGTSMGFTSVLYYLCVKYINASIAVVLLMQSVWIGVLTEAFISKKIPSFAKIIAVVFVLFGTALATSIFGSEIKFDFKGFLFGFLAAISFSMTLYSTNSVAKHLNPFKRSLFMLFGGGIIVLIFSLLTQLLPTYLNLHLIGEEFISVKIFDTSILYTWGILLSVFGTVLPPILLNKGFPLTGVGLGSIVSAVELPVSVTFAFIFLQEQVLFSQWIGILIILGAVLLINWNLIRRK